MFINVVKTDLFIWRKNEEIVSYDKRRNRGTKE